MARHIALFGGMFDPVHCGHVAVITALANLEMFDEVWVIPAAMSPHKEHVFFSDEDRLSLLEQTVLNSSNVKVLKLELERGAPSYTCDTVEACCTRYPNDQFSLVMGSDQFFKFDTWKDPHKILEQVRVRVFNREAYVQESEYETYINTVMPKAKGRVDFLALPVVPVSSSLIRDCLGAKTSVRGLVPRTVYRALKGDGYIESTQQVVGVSGRAGVGKSTAVSVFQEMADLTLIDLDVLGHQVLNDAAVKEALLRCFGTDILDESGTISRPALGARVFSNPVELQQLNAIVHPKMKEKALALLSSATHNIVIIEGALIQEIGLLDLCDTYLVIDAEHDAIMAHTTKDIAPILQNQRTQEEYNDGADVTIVNTFDAEFDVALKTFFQASC